MKKEINTSSAPLPIGPYSQAIKYGNQVFVSGQIAINPETGKLEIDDLSNETHRVMKNLEAVLKEAGMGFNNIVKCSIFLSNMKNFSLVNEIYGSYLNAPYPARETVEVSVLPKNVNVEISAIAIE